MYVLSNAVLCLWILLVVGCFAPNDMPDRWNCIELELVVKLLYSLTVKRIRLSCTSTVLYDNSIRLIRLDFKYIRYWKHACSWYNQQCFFVCRHLGDINRCLLRRIETRGRAFENPSKQNMNVFLYFNNEMVSSAHVYSHILWLSELRK